MLPESILSAILCMSEAGFFESRSEPFLDQVAVAYTVQNRVDAGLEDSHCAAVHAGKYQNGKPVRHKCAYSYFCDGLPETIPASDRRAYGPAVLAAALVRLRLIADPTNGSTDYHDRSVSPGWPYKATLTTRAFVFYVRPALLAGAR